MKAKEILEGDELIANFMEWEKSKTKSFVWYRPLGRAVYMEIKHMKFSTSWDWLMPVVERIQSLHVKYRLRGQIPGNHPADTIFTLSIFSSITRVYDSVMTFIEWYEIQEATVIE